MYARTPPSVNVFHRFSTSFLSLLTAAGLFFFLSSCGVTHEADRPYQSAAARYVPGPDKSVLQTPCYRLTDARGRRVELTGAIHIAEKSYYRDLNKHLRTFDAVLFEGVGSPPSKHPKAAPAAQSAPKKEPEISRIYSTMAHDYLHLSLQGEEIDYTRPNFIHADVSAQEFNNLLKQRGMTMDSMVKTSRFSPGLQTSRWLLGVMKYLLPTGDPDAMKRIAAPDLAKAENSADLPPATYDVIVIQRNKHLLQVMDRELAAGKKNLSLFYGSGHFEDLRKQLHARGWHDAGTEWRDAWIIAPEKR
jgi:hypothetical protein